MPQQLSEEEMEQARQWEEVEEETEEVGLRKTRSQNHAAVPPAPAPTATATVTTTEFGSVRIEDEVVFEERVDVEDGRGKSSSLYLLKSSTFGCFWGMGRIMNDMGLSLKSTF